MKSRRWTGRRHAPTQNSRLENVFELDELLNDSHRRKARHKDQQLCRQVAQTLSLALAGCADALLRDLYVADVVPAPDAGRLLVSVYPMAGVASSGSEQPSDVMSVERMSQILGRLEAAAPMLRREVASAITRKRAPQLLFRVVAGGEVLP